MVVALLILILGQLMPTIHQGFLRNPTRLWWLLLVYFVATFLFATKKKWFVGLMSRFNNDCWINSKFCWLTPHRCCLKSWFCQLPPQYLWVCVRVFPPFREENPWAPEVLQKNNVPSYVDWSKDVMWILIPPLIGILIMGTYQPMNMA